MSGQQKFSMDGYVDVAERIVQLRDKHPEASLQPANLDEPFRIERVGDETFIVVVAACYRSPDDPRPGIGMAYETYPGRTPYTKGSELQNAETSAWGRAIMAALAADSRRVASADEVRNRRAEQQPDPRASLRAQIAAKGRDHGWSANDTAADFSSWSQGDVIAEADEPTLRRYLDYLGTVAA